MTGLGDRHEIGQLLELHVSLAYGGAGGGFGAPPGAGENVRLLASAGGAVLRRRADAEPIVCGYGNHTRDDLDGGKSPYLASPV
ncbi:hypothetical protein GCM10017673_34880 [Streptosporangium violaceochromogenes]|nr:hypothetical protein GCM10017673_34880 [Streptosporangium violaceochromogenes]